MTARRFRWGLLAIFLLAAAANLLLLLAYGCGRADILVTLLPRSFGAGLGIFLLAGVIPFVWLAWRRFDVRRAAGSLQLWAVLAALFFAMSAYTMNFQHSVGDFAC